MITLKRDAEAHVSVLLGSYCRASLETPPIPTGACFPISGVRSSMVIMSLVRTGIGVGPLRQLVRFPLPCFGRISFLDNLSPCGVFCALRVSEKPFFAANQVTEEAMSRPNLPNLELKVVTKFRHFGRLSGVFGATCPKSLLKPAARAGIAER